LLIDPTVDDPWDYLFFEPTTGQVVARKDPVSMLSHPRGDATCDPHNLPLNVEAITEGRVRAARRLSRLVNRFLIDMAIPATQAHALEQLVEEVREIDAQGVVSWYLRREGRHTVPFSTMAHDYPPAWADLIARTV
jgi:hypothetical protein